MPDPICKPAGSNRPYPLEKALRSRNTRIEGPGWHRRARPRWRHMVPALILMSPIGQCDGCDRDPTVVDPPDPLAITVSPTLLDLEVGMVRRIEAVVTGGNASAPRTVTFTSSNTTVASVDASGDVRGEGRGNTTITVSAVADPNVRQTVPVGVTLAPTIEISSVNVGGTGTPVDVNNVAGRIDVAVVVTDAAPGSKVELLVGDDVVACQSLPTTNPAQTQCEIDTGKYDPLNGQAAYTNGQYNILGKYILGNGAVRLETGISMRFNNSNRLLLGFNGQGALGPGPQTGGATWRGPGVDFQVQPVTYDGAGPAFVSLRGTGRNGGLGVDFGNGPGMYPSRVGAPFMFSLDPGLNPDVEGPIDFTPRGYDQSGNAIMMGAINKTMLHLNLDLRMPDISLTRTPPVNNAVNYPAVRLTYQTGPYAPQTIIPLSWIQNGVVVGDHLACSVAHLHGDIIITDPNTGQTHPPFADPQFTRNDECGHGEVLNWRALALIFPFQGSITDPWLRSATLRFFSTSGSSCSDPLTLVEQGTNPGQADVNARDLFSSANSFSTTITLNTAEGYTPVGGYCARFDAADATTGRDGQPAPNTRTVFFWFRVSL